MKVKLNLTGPELVLLYLAYGNESARALLKRAIQKQASLTRLARIAEKKAE